MPQPVNMPLLTGPQQSLPDGQFILPVCVDRESCGAVLDAVYYSRNFARDGEDYTGMWPVLEALAYVQTPNQAPCAPDCQNLCDIVLELLSQSGPSADLFLELLAARLLADCEETLANAILGLVYG